MALALMAGRGTDALSGAGGGRVASCASGLPVVVVTDSSPAYAKTHKSYKLSIL